MDKRFLRKEGTVWYADFSDSPFPEELAVPAGYIERAKKQITVKFEHRTATGWGLCAAHRKLFEEGYIALVECDPQRSGLPAGGDHLKPEQAYRTGRLAHVRRTAFARLFDVPIDAGQAWVFVAPGVIERLQAMVTRAGL